MYYPTQSAQSDINALATVLPNKTLACFERLDQSKVLICAISLIQNKFRNDPYVYRYNLKNFFYTRAIEVPIKSIIAIVYIDDLSLSIRASTAERPSLG